MTDSAHLAVFVGMVAVLVIVPGPNTVLILSNSLRGGRAAGLMTVAGVETGTLAHTAAAALGISSVLASSATSFAVMKYAGAAYLVWLGVRALTERHHARHPTRPAAATPRLSQTFWRAVVANVLNPKVAVFFLALLPQFVKPERGHLVLQFAALGAIVSLVGLAVGSALALGASAAQAWLRRDRVRRWQERVAGGALIALGVQLALAPR